MLKLKLQHFGHLMQRDPEAGKDRQQKERAAEDEMVGWHHRLSGHEFEQALRDSEEQEACYAAVHGVAKIRI